MTDKIKTAKLTIIHGLLKGEKIFISHSRDIRPTRQLVREAVFQIWADMISGAVLLDPFAGSGAIAIEALSRGAEEIYISDIRPDYIFNLRKTLRDIEKKRKETVDIDKIIISSDDYNEALANHFAEQRKFDLIYLDPPYQSGFGLDAIKLIIRYELLKEDGRILLEVSKRESRETELFIENEENLLLLKKYKYGDNYLYHFALDQECLS